MVGDGSTDRGEARGGVWNDNIQWIMNEYVSRGQARRFDEVEVEIV